MRQLTTILFISALIFGCGQEQAMEEQADKADSTAKEATAKDKVSTSDYKKKYESAMQEAMAAAKQKQAEVAEQE